MPTLSARGLWQSALGSLQLEVSRHNFETWLKHTEGLEWDGSRLTVGVPSTFVAECLEKRLAPVVLKTLRRLLQQDVELRCEVRQLAGLSSPLLAGPPEEELAPAPSRARSGRLGMRSTPLNPRYTFSTFVVGKSNRFAHAAAIAVAENPGHSYNPLFLHAGVGLGKTHLLHAIGHVVAAKKLEYLFVSAEQFTNDFVTALRENRAEEFRAKYRTTDVLLFDDIQFIAGKEHSKESFFHTFNDLHASNKQIVITSDSRPKSIPLVEERLISRFEGGLIADIQPPELETRLAILQVKAQQAGVALTAEVSNFIARKILGNVRELEGALNRLLVAARLANRPIDLEIAQQSVAEIPSSPARRRHFIPSAILEAVAAFYDISPEALASKTRTQQIAHARQVAAYLLREETGRSLADVGRLLGDRGHTTALRAHAKIASDLNMDAELRHQIGEIRATLEQRHVVSA